MRRANIHTIDNIIMTHSATFCTVFPEQETEDDAVWPYVLVEVILSLLEQAIAKFGRTKMPVETSDQVPC